MKKILLLITLSILVTPLTSQANMQTELDALPKMHNQMWIMEQKAIVEARQTIKLKYKNKHDIEKQKNIFRDANQKGKQNIVRSRSSQKLNIDFSLSDTKNGIEYSKKWDLIVTALQKEKPLFKEQVKRISWSIIWQNYVGIFEPDYSDNLFVKKLRIKMSKKELGKQKEIISVLTYLYFNL